MHDLLEVQAMYDFKLVVSKLLANINYNFSIDLLNKRISQFNYGLIEQKNKPSSSLTAESISNVSKDHHVQKRTESISNVSKDHHVPKCGF